MADIRNSISLVDRMTPTLRSILKSMDSTLRVMKNLDKASNNGVQSKAYRRAEKDIQRANYALIKMGNYTKMANNAARQGEKAYSRMGSAASGAARSIQSIGNASSFLHTLSHGVYLAEKLANALGRIMSVSDESRSHVARLGLYNTSAYSNEELYGQVLRTALNTRSDITDTADLANKLLVSGVLAGDNAAPSAIGIAGIINKALVAGGGTSEENQRALRQLTQGLASGGLQGDELRSIREQTPYFAQTLAEGLAQVDEKFEGIGIGDLKELGAEGELTADRIIKAMLAMQDEIDADFSKMPKTFGQGLTALKSLGKYFLWMLSAADGPLGKINDKLWQFVDYLQSPKGAELMEDVATGIDVVATALSWALDAAGKFVTYLQDNVPVAQALFIALGAAAVASGISAFISWLSACWVILLLVAIVGLIAYAFLSAGYSAQEVIGAIAGGVMWLGAAIWDAVIGIVWVVMWAIAYIIIALIGIGTVILNAFQIIVQGLMFIVLSVGTAVDFVILAIANVFMELWAHIQITMGRIVDKVYDDFSSILDIIAAVARAIDSIFGTNLSAGVATFRSQVDEVYTTVSGFLDAGKTFDSIDDMWAEFGEGTAYKYSKESDWNITDNIADVWNAGNDLAGGVWDLAGTGSDYLKNQFVDPSKYYDSGYEWGTGIVDKVEGMDFGLPGDSVLGAFNADGVQVGGGSLDSVGSIKNDVNISDEDLKLLRDMTARDYLLQLQSITPVANVTFGDVRETADVSKIVDVIEQMVEEQMATSLVG
jgi:tape measure domain-containing protein